MKIPHWWPDSTRSSGSWSQWSWPTGPTSAAGRIWSCLLYTSSHIEHFGSREKILEAKSEIFHHVKSGAFVVINGDDPLLNTLPGKLPYAFTRVGAGEGLDYRAERLVSDGKSHMTCEVKTPHNFFPVEIPALGDHMIYPTLMAAAVGEHFGLTQTQIADGVLHFAPTKMRMNLLHRDDDITILNDTYNANPQSMRAAVEVLSSARGAYKVAVLGDMFELGPLAPALHAGVGDYLGKAGIDCLVAVSYTHLRLPRPGGRREGAPRLPHGPVGP